MRLLTSFFAGVIFAIGLGISQMTDPGKVQSFLDLAGTWDPSLAFVMVGAIGIYAITHALIVKRDAPVCEVEFNLPDRKKAIDLSLIVGAALFGIGWGLGGFCPGPAISRIAQLQSEVLVFCGAMLVGMFIFQTFVAKKTASE